MIPDVVLNTVIAVFAFVCGYLCAAWADREHRKDRDDE